MSQSETEHINRTLSRCMEMTLSQLQEFNLEIYQILNRGTISTDCERRIRKDRYLRTMQNGIEIQRDFIGSEEEVTRTIVNIDLSYQNQKDLLNVSNILGMMISDKIGVNSVIKFLHKYADDPNNQLSINEALNLTSKFLGTHAKDHEMSLGSDSLARFTSFDGLRQVRCDIDPRHCRGLSHFNFEIMNTDKQKLNKYLNELSDELKFNVKTNYHLFVSV